MTDKPQYTVTLLPGNEVRFLTLSRAAEGGAVSQPGGAHVCGRPLPGNRQDSAAFRGQGNRSETESGEGVETTWGIHAEAERGGRAAGISDLSLLINAVG
jgi:hypothetical protein